MEKKLNIAKIILYNNGTSGGSTIFVIILYYRAKVMKTAWYWHKNSEAYQQNQIKDPDIKPHTFNT